MKTSLPLLFIVNLALFTSACDLPDKDLGEEASDEAEESGTEESEAEESGTDTSDNPFCAAGSTPVGTFAFDVEAFPEVVDGGTPDNTPFEYTGQCQVTALELVDGQLSLMMDCPHTTPDPIPVGLTASASVIPSGVEVGSTLTFTALLGFDFGGDASGPIFYGEFSYWEFSSIRIDLSDAQGVVASYFNRGPGDYEFGSLSVDMLPCSEYEFPNIVQGYLEAHLGEQTVQISDGFVETISDGNQTYQIANYASVFDCCHSYDIVFGVLRQ